MLTAGDEMGRSQGGNNNAYCQDSPISWVSWDPALIWEPLIGFTGQLADLRAAHPALRPPEFLTADEVVDADGKGLGRPQLAWLNGYDGAMKDADWFDGGRRLLGLYESNADEAFIVWFYSGATPIDVTLPGAPYGDAYHVLLHTGLPEEFPDAGVTLEPTQKITLPARTVVVMSATFKPPAPAASAPAQPAAVPRPSTLP
jgi:glycogen operon protein